MHRLSSSFVLGYHGCDQVIADKLVAGEQFQPSRNNYDWLGPGSYFWDSNPKRALEFAEELKKLKRGPKIKNPAVVGAVIDLGLCLDLTTSAGIAQVKSAYQQFLTIAKVADYEIPENSEDLLRRNLDCAVINLLHAIRKNAEDPAIDTVRGVFIEGDPVFESSGFRDKTHIQICVCNPECIKGVFKVRDSELD